MWNKGRWEVEGRKLGEVEEKEWRSKQKREREEKGNSDNWKVVYQDDRQVELHIVS
jgi:hypothetical protein